MTAAATPAPARTAALHAARAKDSQDKRRRALAAIEALEAAGAPITFPAVAKAARVSVWLVYTEGIRENVEAARRHQADQGVDPRAGGAESDQQRATPAGVRTDLSVARQEIRRLRSEHDLLIKRFRLHLGAEIEGPDKAELIARTADLEAVNRKLVAERDARGAEADTARRRVDELEDELTAARESLRRLIREQNRAR